MMCAVDWSKLCCIVSVPAVSFGYVFFICIGSNCVSFSNILSAYIDDISLDDVCQLNKEIIKNTRT